MNPNTRRILMIDDDEFMLNLYSSKFKKKGFEFLGLSNADDNLIEKVVQFKPDIVSLDIVMPGRDGLEAATLLKATPETKNIPIFCLSNQNSEEYIEKAKSIGVVGYIVPALMAMNNIVDIYTKYLVEHNDDFIDFTKSNNSVPKID